MSVNGYGLLRERPPAEAAASRPAALTGREVPPVAYPEARPSSAHFRARGAPALPRSVVDRLERAPEALARMLAGDTVGKTLVRIA
jgi:hypothetical protein